MTEEGEKLKGTPWNVYPRPQLVRDNWQNLNGSWSFGYERDKTDQEIRIPFCPESLLSGVKDIPEDQEIYWYKKTFKLEIPTAGKKILLHFGAVDQLAKVWLNGELLGSHAGGYLPFVFDVTGCLKEENELLVEAEDSLSHDLPWGKQKKLRGGMWYTPVSGIWQTVWLEAVPETYITKLEIRTEGAKAHVMLRLNTKEMPGEGICTLLADDGTPLKTQVFSGEEVCIAPEEPEFWSPEHPKLYRFALTVGGDTVRSYFALRTLDIREINGKKRLCLNGEPYFFNGLLDQGYFSDGIYTPAVPAAYEKDILGMKSLGYNTLRKHIKVEPEQFYYDCDRLGMAVFQDMVNVGDYRFFTDTALPTVGLQNLGDSRRHRSASVRSSFETFMKAETEHLMNHPCIVYWTIFNEAWGQFAADEMYRKLKAVDDSRFIDATSGWFHQKESDVDSLHIYFKPLHEGKEKDKALVISEFGGYIWKVPEHSANPESTYGYRDCRTREDFVQAFRALYENEMLPLAEQGACAAIYTQVSDVEDETNGLFTYDRKLLKLKPEETLDIMTKFAEAVKK